MQKLTFRTKTRQTNNIFLISALIMTLILTRCSDSHHTTTVTTTIDTTKIQTSLTSKPETIVIIREDRAELFPKKAKEINVNKKANRPFNKLDYNKVIAYDYEGGKGKGVVNIISNDKLAPTVRQQKELTQEQIDYVTNFLGDNSTYGSGIASCFDPHLGLVFYKDSKIVAHISICLECNHLSSSVKIPAEEVRKIKIGDDYEYPAKGFSKSGRRKINFLCRQLNFSHCADSLNSMFDE